MDVRESESTFSSENKRRNVCDNEHSDSLGENVIQMSYPRDTSSGVCTVSRNDTVSLVQNDGDNINSCVKGERNAMVSLARNDGDNIISYRKETHRNHEQRSDTERQTSNKKHQNCIHYRTTLATKESSRTCEEVREYWQFAIGGDVREHSNNSRTFDNVWSNDTNQCCRTNTRDTREYDGNIPEDTRVIRVCSHSNHRRDIRGATGRSCDSSNDDENETRDHRLSTLDERSKGMVCPLQDIRDHKENCENDIRVRDDTQQLYTSHPQTTVKIIASSKRTNHSESSNRDSDFATSGEDIIKRQEQCCSRSIESQQTEIFASRSESTSLNCSHLPGANDENDEVLNLEEYVTESTTPSEEPAPIEQETRSPRDVGIEGKRVSTCRTEEENPDYSASCRENTLQQTVAVTDTETVTDDNTTVMPYYVWYSTLTDDADNDEVTISTVGNFTIPSRYVVRNDGDGDERPVTSCLLYTSPSPRDS